MTGFEQVPRHVAFIMDGNGRWAERRGLARSAGHREGLEALRRLLGADPARQIPVLTVYAFSADNWKRPVEEIAKLFALMQRYLDEDFAKPSAGGIRLQLIGRRDRLPGALARSISCAEARSAQSSGQLLRIAIDYSGKEAILRAAASVRAATDLTARGFSRLVSPHDAAGDVDLLIRTGGEQRLSDFMIWECAHAELLFSDRLWPDFTPADLRAALKTFAGRQRRFGALPNSTRSEEDTRTGLPAIQS